MSLPDPDRFWLERWKALRAAINDTLKEVDGAEPFVSLLTELREFGAGQFYYFFLGFSDDLSYLSDGELNALLEEVEFSKVQRLAKDAAYPPDYVLRSTTDRIANDLEVIQRAYHQRKARTDGPQVKTLKLVDAWGQSILEKFSNSGREEFTQLLDRTPRVVSYFTHFPHIRVIPYAYAALVGIPLTATVPNRRRDLLVVPHELGHYVYYHGTIQDQPIHKMLSERVPDKPTFLKNWSEELFADVFAISSTGYVLAMVHWALSMVKDNTPESYWKDDNTHPIDVIRMYLYLDPLRPDEGVAGFFQERRETIATAKGVSAGLPPEDDRGDAVTDYSIQELRDMLIPITSAIYADLGKRPLPFASDLEDFLQAFLKNLDGLPEELKTSVMAEDRLELLRTVTPEVVFEHFGSRARVGALLSALEKSGNNNPEQWYRSFELKLEEFAPQGDGQEGASSIDAREMRFVAYRNTYQAEDPLECKDWKPVFEAGGWTTKGPQTGPTGAWEDPDWRDSGIHR